MNGLGVALRLQTLDGNNGKPPLHRVSLWLTLSWTGFQLKYLLSYFHDNNIGLTDGLGQSLSDYYSDNSSWQPSGTTKYNTTISNINVPISCSTPALSGASDEYYQFDVYIGLKPGSDFGKPRPALPPRKRLERPEPIGKPKPGTIVHLPNGGKIEVGE